MNINLLLRFPVFRKLKGNEKASLILEAMAYQIAKNIGVMSTVLHGQGDGNVLTGGLANCARLIDWITKWVSFIGPVKVYPGEDEMLALTKGALGVLSGTESVNHYSPPG